MTVYIEGMPSGIEDMARIAVDRELDGRKSYDSYLRQQAIDAIVDFRPAYVRLSDYSDQLSTNAAVWAMGGTLGVKNLDPVIQLHGLRQVANHMAALWPDDFDRKIRVVLRNLKPINAMAQLDRELLLEERGISRTDVEHGEDK